MIDESNLPPPKSSRSDPRPARSMPDKAPKAPTGTFQDLLNSEGPLTPEDQVATSEEQPTEEPETPEGIDDGEAEGETRAEEDAAAEDEPEEIAEDDPSEEIEEPDEDPAEDPDESPTEDQDEVAALRAELAQLKQEQAETLAFLREQRQSSEPERPQGERDPEVEEAASLFLDPALSEKDRDEALKAYTPLVRRKAHERAREVDEERRLLLTDPDAWAERRLAPKVAEIERRFEERERQRAVDAFKARNRDLYADPKSRARLVQVLEQGARTGKVDADQAALLVRQEIQVAKAKQAATKTESRARDQRARKAAARTQGGKRAEPRAGGETRRLTGKETTFRELLDRNEGQKV